MADNDYNVNYSWSYGFGENPVYEEWTENGIKFSFNENYDLIWYDESAKIWKIW